MTKKILMVDDEPNIRKLVRVILEAKGYEVLEAQSGAECMSKADPIIPKEERNIEVARQNRHH